MRTSVIYIVSNINKALAFEWVAPGIDKNKFEISFILLNPGPTALESFLIESGIKVNRITYHGKKDIPQSLYKIISLLKKEKPQVIHCHLFDASIIGLLAGRICGVKKNIYTRHHSSLHHIYFPRAVYYDKLINFLATDIIAISGKVKEILILQEKVHKEKVVLIPHGFKLEEFTEPNPGRWQILENKYNPKKSKPVIGAISRYTHWKGLQYTIKAFRKLLETYPDALLILANASGDYKARIQELLQDIPTRNYQEIPFEPDIMALYQLFDVFVHVPVDDHSEAFGQTYVEALAAGIPSVFTLSSIANEFIKDKENAIVVPYKDAEAIYQSILILLTDLNLKAKLVKNGKVDVMQRFKFDKFIRSLEDLYLS